MSSQPVDPNAKHQMAIPVPQNLPPNPFPTYGGYQGKNPRDKSWRTGNNPGPRVPVNVSALLSAVEGIVAITDAARAKLPIDDPAWDAFNRIDMLVKDARAGGGSDFWWDRAWLHGTESEYRFFVTPQGSMDAVRYATKTSADTSQLVHGYLCPQPEQAWLRGVLLIPGGAMTDAQIQHLRERATFKIYMAQTSVAELPMAKLLLPVSAETQARETAALLAQEPTQTALWEGLRERELRLDRAIHVAPLEQFEIRLHVDHGYNSPFPYHIDGADGAEQHEKWPSLQVLLRGYKLRHVF